MEKSGKEKIVLVVVVLALAAAVGFTFLRSGEPTAPPKDKASISEEKSAEKAAAAKKEAAKPALPSPQAVAGGATGSNPNRNPFTAPGEVQAPPKPAPTMTAKANAAANGFLAAAPETPVGAATAAPGGAESAAAPEEALQLKGVISGKIMTAVLRKGAQTMIVRRGDKVDKEYTVTQIGPGQVTLKSKDGNKIILHLGGGV
jgi:hypothetical protein